ncbi:MAG TPA: Asp-tRNA(Asn)/Glu-tRNA(Gln) amidotransferase subunit GatC [Chthonomonas sp.]|jgi:aspartyl-tRNA(Asn)/glutamyl-tRNA(Gln) amidotransferase subunit C|uniref:Asp-tRNA(Asn)/Glu-tRNA(Gln) amidotransferase subunit GatC n=1 Tax=Chthonomonas sp. TaxID=2282153 RepID=UPI002B4B93BC|nr:Asp-tRNA(Asn)/Glu-tRNA(Gln) amidotransferase subunit GatC [Chthonomonas sp.]HLH79701.1 Asp-tRNA(Asn)/Glu-tRNA(Gln) amidotransferase subunit GatC [Chthonomonas sp.]HLI49338.1 Asp-tRNA(Asn)/Glu-tRNA(Gln) amidotransferase subunit GatC [Chthonomonas sp.]
MALTPEEVRKVALLARLELTDEEVLQQAQNINNLLQQFEKLQQLDLEGVEPTSHSIPVYNVLRADQVTPSLPREELLANAPEAREGYFVVPRIVEDA